MYTGYTGTTSSGGPLKVILILVGLVLTVTCNINSCVGGYNIQKQTTSYLARAQVAADADDMLQYVQSCKKAMQTNGWDHGHTAFVFETPANDLGLVTEALTKLEERLTAAQKFNHASPEYQVAMDDCRGIIRELLGEGEGNYSHVSSSDIYYRFYGGGWVWAGIAVGILMMLIGFVVAVSEI